MARVIACQWGKNSWHCAWGCVEMRVRWSSACHVVAKILKCSKKNFLNVLQLVAVKLLSSHAWHWVSRMSWTVRNLCVTDGTTQHDMAQTMHYQRIRGFTTMRYISRLFTYLLTYLAVLTDFVPLKWHDLARHIAGHCRNKILASVRLDVNIMQPVVTDTANQMSSRSQRINRILRGISWRSSGRGRMSFCEIKQKREIFDWITLLHRTWHCAASNDITKHGPIIIGWLQTSV